jgi:hypothetical protein
VSELADSWLFDRPFITINLMIVGGLVELYSDVGQGLLVFDPDSDLLVCPCPLAVSTVRVNLVLSTVWRSQEIVRTCGWVSD